MDSLERSHCLIEVRCLADPVEIVRHVLVATQIGPPLLRVPLLHFEVGGKTKVLKNSRFSSFCFLLTMLVGGGMAEGTVLVLILFLLFIVEHGEVEFDALLLDICLEHTHEIDPFGVQEGVVESVLEDGTVEAVEVFRNLMSHNDVLN
jgi:hypothetical protein